MKKLIISEFDNTNILEKLSLIVLLLLPLALAISILIAEIFAALIGIFALTWILKNQENLKIFQDIKIPIYITLLFFLIILISLGFSYNFNKSFLPSFFYFRYLLLSLGIFILIYKFEQTLKLILTSLLLLLFLVLIDCIFEGMKINNLFGLKLEEYRYSTGTSHYLTGFFEDEKKLGSFLVRLCPLILSLVIFFNIKVFNKFDVKIPLLMIMGVLIFFSSERVALFLFFFIIIFLLKIFKRRFIFLSFSFLTLFLLITSQPKFFEKYIYATLTQFGVLNQYSMYEGDKRVKIIENLNFSDVNYMSDEHEKLLKSGLIIFKENILTGSGLKNYHRYCKNIKEERSLDIRCSSHPHNTYVQILSDVGIFGGLLILSIFIYLFSLNIKILFIKNPPTIIKSFYVLNLGIIVNLMPIIPSGSFFNNWMNLMLYFPLGTWLYLFYYIKKDKRF